MHPSSSSHPPNQPNSKSPPAPAPGGAAYFAAPPPANGNAGVVAAFGVAYPYPAPPPHHHPPPPPPPHHYHYHPYPPHHHHHHPYPPPPPPPTCLRRLLALAAAAFLLLGAGTFIVWLLLRQRAPAFSLASLSRVAYSDANSTLSASFDASLLANNPNSKLSVSYFSALAFVALAPSSPIAVASLPPFSQGPGNTTTLAFRLEVDGSYVGPDEAAPLKSGGAGTLEVQVRLVAVAVFDRGGWRTRRRVMMVMCDGVPVRFRGKNVTEAAFDGLARRCDVVL